MAITEFSMKLWSSNGKSDSNVTFSSLQDFIPINGQTKAYESFRVGHSLHWLRSRFDYVEPSSIYAVELSFDGCEDDTSFTINTLDIRWRSKDNFGQMEAIQNTEYVTRNGSVRSFGLFVDEAVFQKPFNGKLPNDIDTKYDFWFESIGLQTSAGTTTEDTDLPTTCTNTETTESLKGKGSRLFVETVNSTPTFVKT